MQATGLDTAHSHSMAHAAQQQTCQETDIRPRCYTRHSRPHQHMRLAATYMEKQSNSGPCTCTHDPHAKELALQHVNMAIWMLAALLIMLSRSYLNKKCLNCIS